MMSENSIYCYVIIKYVIMTGAWPSTSFSTSTRAHKHRTNSDRIDCSAETIIVIASKLRYLLSSFCAGRLLQRWLPEKAYYFESTT
eukprot:scaffold589_cov135-Skeletonema_marinoi.AAC.7